MGKARCESLHFARDPHEVQMRLAETEEVRFLRNAGEPLPLRECADLHDALGRLRAAGVLAPDELLRMVDVLALGRTLARSVSLRKDRVPRLAATITIDPNLADVEDEVRKAFDSDGTLADHASPRLRELRGEYRAARARIMSRLEDMMQKYEHVLQDPFITEREGRYVLPVRSDSHERFPGIVHGSSGSGHTLFVEPRVIIDLGNRLKMLEGDVAREEIAVYAHLSAELEEHLPSIMGCVEMIAKTDQLAACAQLAEDLNLVRFEVANEPILDLKNARHPLLALDGIAVVGSDLSIEAGHAMVVSGPNAGGKTVSLKTLGLCTLMARMGMPIPAAEGSRVGFFERVVTDVGDDQSLQKNLSTFSAHVQNLVTILDETARGTLVLLDELAGGTDPREGEALAVGVLDSLCARGGAVVVTTHYEGLKAVALGDPRFKNASVGFDRERLAPTFQFHEGMPGASSALDVARKHGLPATVVERAERFLSREDKSFEDLVKRLHDERMALEFARAEFERQSQATIATRQELEGAIAEARNKAHKRVSDESDAFFASLARAREQLRHVQAELRAKNLTREQAKDAEKNLDAAAREANAVAFAVRAASTPRASSESAETFTRNVQKGTRVYVARLRMHAEVLERVDGGRVRVAVGPMKIVVSEGELEPPIDAAPAAPKGAPKPSAGAGVKPAAGPKPVTAQARQPAIQTTDNTCDLRGLRVDDALALSATFLDRAFGQRLQVVFLVHGHGTGAVRDAIRESLAHVSYVTSFGPGTSAEGGDGATLVWLN